MNTTANISAGAGEWMSCEQNEMAVELIYDLELVRRDIENAPTSKATAVCLETQRQLLIALARALGIEEYTPDSVWLERVMCP